MPAATLRRPRSIVLLATILLLTGLVATPARAGTTYYVDSGASCPGSGTVGSPYCNFDTINSTTFVGGDQILLKRGSQWNQQLTLQGSGTSGSHVVLADYGTGNKPKIIRSGGTDTAIWMWNPSYWDVTNIEVGNAQTGIGVYYSGTNAGSGLTFTGIYAHDIRGPEGRKRGVKDGATTSSSTTITSATMTFTSNDVGMEVSGPGIAADTYIASVTNSTTAVMSSAATATGSNVKILLSRRFTNGATTNDSTTLTSATANFKAIDVGKQLFGSGIAADTYISSVTNSTTVILSNAATATATGVTVDIGSSWICQTPSSGTYNVMWSAGISISGCDASGRAQGGVVSDVIIDDYESTDGQNGLVSMHVDDAIFRNLHLHDDDNDGGIDCGWGIFFLESKNITVVDSTVDNEASCYKHNGVAAVIAAFSAYINYSNSIINGVPDTESYDQAGFDYDWQTDHINLYGNLISNNFGNGVEFLALDGRTGDFNSNHEVSGNTFYSNGNNDMTDDFIGWGAIRRYGDNITPTGTISNNLFQEPQGFNSSQGGGDFSGFAFSGNRVFSTTQSSYVKAVAMQYGTQGVLGYSYQYRTCSSCAWTNLSTFSNGVWSNGGGSTDPQISQFAMTPGSSASCTTSNPCDVSVKWVAPTSGKITVRSRVLESDNGCGDGVLARVTKTSGGTTTNLWPVSGDTTVSNETNPVAGSAANLDDISVSANDVIRFQVNMNTSASCDTTSWSPSIVYTDDEAYSWDFDTASGFEGWTVYTGTWSVASGSLSNSCGTCPGAVISPNYLGLDGAMFDQVTVTLTNNSGASRTGQIWYVTDTDASWTLTKTVTVPNGHNTVTFDMSGEDWASGTVQQFSFLPIDSAHTVNIDSISLTK